MSELAGAATPLGAQLRLYRERAGLSQEALAERAGLAAAAISALERGVRRHPFPHTLAALATALDLSATERATFIAAARPAGAQVAMANGTANGAAHDPIAGSAASAPPSNLPLPPTPLIGREREVTALTGLLCQEDVHLVTLTGVGGAGKTRLALEVASKLARAEPLVPRAGSGGGQPGTSNQELGTGAGPGEVRFPDGVWLIELAPLADPVLVPQAVAAALGVRETAGVALLDSLIAVLQRQALLLVLDNCEHVLVACAALAARLLATCPALRILATSREPLQIAGERQRPMPPLATPDPAQPVAVEDLAGYPAVHLFLARAQAVAPDFALTPENAAAVVQVCARLDGIPLALELAAARVRVLALDQIAERLDDCLRLLTGGSRAGPTRQQTLRAAMDWSYDLLTEREKALFNRLSVFAGGFILEAAEAVCAGEGIEPDDVLDLLTRLIDKSLVVAEEQPSGAARYRLLEPLRQYARTHLAASGAADALAARHAAYYRQFAEATLGQRDDQTHRPANHVFVVLARLAGAFDDLRAALAWFVRAGDAVQGGRLGAALGDLWVHVGQLTEGRQRLAEVLALPAAPYAEHATLRVKLLDGAAELAWQQGDYPAVAALRAEQLAISQQLGDLHGIATAANWLGVVAREQGDFTTARTWLEESRAAYEQLQDRAGLAIIQDRLGTVLHALGDYDAADALYQASFAVWLAAGEEMYLGWSLLNQALLAADRQDLDGAARLAVESLVRFRQGISEHAILHALGLFAHLAAVRAQAGLSGERGAIDAPLARRALRLHGAVDGLCAGLFVRLMPSYRRQLEPALATVCASLPSDEVARLHAQGQAMTLQQAIAAALADAPATTTSASSAHPAPVAAGGAEPLTRRECEVAALIAAGCHTDRQIAARLTITPSTAGVHVQRILDKLGLHSRWQVAAWATAHGLGAASPT